MQTNRGALACLGGVMLFASAGFTRAAPQTMATTEIRPGMRGYGLSVFQGTEPERFDVEVIDVLENFRPDQDMVLIKTPHPLLDHAGSVAGMSGSPIYLDNRLVGAYAYGWAFGKDPIAGVTPIANMLRELERPLLQHVPSLASPLPVSATRAEREQSVRARAATFQREGRRDAFDALSRIRRRDHDGEQFRPAATPLLVGGLSSQVAELLRERFAPLGLEVLEAAGSGSSRHKSHATAYANGGSVAVTLLRGDVQATAVGTVTHVDGKRAVAFGHPMLEVGQLSLPTSTSRVLHILASERSSFKIAEALEPLGALVNDRQSAVVIDTEAKAHTIPIDIHLRGIPASQRAHWRVQAADHRLLTPALVMTAISSAIGASVNDAADVMFHSDSVVTLKKHGPQRVVDEGYSPMGAALAVSRLRLFDLLSIAYDNPFGSDEVERVDITLDLRFAHDVTEIIGAQLSKDELDPGEPARVVLTLRPYAGPVEQRIVEVPLPETLAGEHLELEALAGDRVQLEQPLPRSLADILASVRAGLPSTSLAIVVERKSRGLSLAGHVVQNLPASALDALATSHDTTKSASFAMERRLVWPLGRVLIGSAKLGLDVRREKR
ncbi:MAG: hypothetical protein JWN48_3044 [Myxococcaceae bacterium]|nr:hypothetical protein [Myxococcaceae bacterium]